MTIPVKYVTAAYGGTLGVDYFLRPLTKEEHDGNTNALATAIQELIDNPVAGVSVSNVTVTGRQMRVYMSDGEVFGPFTLTSLAQVPSPVKTVTTTTYTVVAADAGHYIRYTNAAGCAVTLDGSLFAPADGVEIHHRQCTGGPLSFTALGSDALIDTPLGKDAATVQQGAIVTAKYVAADTWDMFGALADASA